MLTPENNQTEIMQRQSGYTPPRSLSHWLIGRPLMTADAPHQTIGKAVGLAVFASDALSSTAYATQEILGILSVAGSLAYDYVFPISIAIVALLDDCDHFLRANHSCLSWRGWRLYCRQG